MLKWKKQQQQSTFRYQTVWESMKSNLNLHFIEILITSSIKIEAKTLWVSSKYPIIPIKRLHLFFLSVNM